MPHIEIYTQAFCPYCSRAVSLLRRKGVRFTEIDAPNGSAARRDALARSGGQSSVPQIFIDGRSIGGCDALMALDQRGALDPLLAV